MAEEVTSGSMFGSSSLVLRQKLASPRNCMNRTVEIGSGQVCAAFGSHTPIVKILGTL